MYSESHAVLLNLGPLRLRSPLYFTRRVLSFPKIVETETRSAPPDESPLLLPAADGVSLLLLLLLLFFGCSFKDVSRPVLQNNLTLILFFSSQ